MVKKSTKEEVKQELPPDDLRCSRTDGRQWRCKRRAMENVKLCEVHYLQGRHRQNKERVPESLKLSNDVKVKKKKKKNDVVEIRSKKNKKKKRKHVDVQLELIRMVLEREVDKKKNVKRNNNEEIELHYSEGELRKELPNGVMEIAPVSTPCDVEFQSNGKTFVAPRYFRSKNVDKRVPFDNLQVLKKCGRKKCHCCQSSDSGNLIKCSNCQKEFFCLDCIKRRYSETPNEVKTACPVCRGTCTCKYCRAGLCKDNESKDHLAGRNSVHRILHFHYLICMLLPVLKQISEEQRTELETEAKNKGKNISDILIKQVEFGRNEKNNCNYCHSSILNLHRSCLSCSYSLCLRCCQALSQGSPFEHINSLVTEIPDKMDVCIDNESYPSDDNTISSDDVTDTSLLSDWTGCNGTTDSVSCPPSELGGCGNTHLDLRCVFPLSWIEEMETKAEEVVCSYEVPEILDKNSSCSLCSDKDHKTNRHKQSQEAARREDSNDNCLFYPTAFAISSDHCEHFQKHWGKGHPVVVRNVLRSRKNLSWDPLVMFCDYLEESISRYENNKDLLEACLDWCEVEINIKQHFTGSLRCRPQKNDFHEMLKLNGWLSSQLFKKQFPDHFAQVIDALPLQEYMNPMSGLLNLAAYMPDGSAKHDKGPYVHISYGCADKEACSVLNLSYEPYDVVDIMAYTTDAPLSPDNLANVTKLLKKHQTLCQRGSPMNTSEHVEDKEQKETESIAMEGTDFYRRVNRTSSINEVKTMPSQSLEENASINEECVSGSDSDSDSEKTQSSLPLRKTVRSTEMYSVAQWDVFRRQDEPKLLEYLKRHADEFSCASEHHGKKMVQPILDQSIFLDTTHKMRLKEEFNIEPWTFEQHVGEAVIVPAGCPYQIRNSKCCVHVVLEFLSPENVAECIQLTDEIHLLPEDHIAKVDMLEARKMALNSVETAIKEIHELTSNPKHD
ncbi:lysine-specific demethylase JMJ28-like [Vicia villosa]|uniref:lysine-specific demethylase JMJ28-like n=1 Tax=Vicia villosa TaxID=3911 RepID=UPI00273BECE3|nr:lysine-specific demethylase JMJ28-like [Vicia villosa]